MRPGMFGSGFFMEHSFHLVWNLLIPGLALFFYVRRYLFRGGIMHIS